MATPELNQKLSPKEEAPREAAGLLETLRQKEGKKALVLAVAKEENTRDILGRFFTKGVNKRDTAYVLSKQDGGASAVRLYQAFRDRIHGKIPRKYSLCYVETH